MILIKNHNYKIKDSDESQPCYECDRDRYILYYLSESDKYLCLQCLSDSIDMINQLKDRGDFITGRDSYL